MSNSADVLSLPFEHQVESQARLYDKVSLEALRNQSDNIYADTSVKITSLRNEIEYYKASHSSVDTKHNYVDFDLLLDLIDKVQTMNSKLYSLRGG